MSIEDGWLEFGVPVPSDLLLFSVPAICFSPLDFLTDIEIPLDLNVSQNSNMWFSNYYDILRESYIPFVKNMAE